MGYRVQKHLTKVSQSATPRDDSYRGWGGLAGLLGGAVVGGNLGASSAKKVERALRSPGRRRPSNRISDTAHILAVLGGSIGGSILGSSAGKAAGGALDDFQEMRQSFRGGDTFQREEKKFPDTDSPPNRSGIGGVLGMFMGAGTGGAVGLAATEPLLKRTSPSTKRLGSRIGGGAGALAGALAGKYVGERTGVLPLLLI
jgi:hypothetical protein